MDISGKPFVGDEIFKELPMGFGMGLAMNDGALRGYAALTESEREELILRCKGVKTKDEMQRIIDSLAPGVDVQEVYEEERGNFK